MNNSERGKNHTRIQSHNIKYQLLSVFTNFIIYQFYLFIISFCFIPYLTCARTLSPEALIQMLCFANLTKLVGKIVIGSPHGMKLFTDFFVEFNFSQENTWIEKSAWKRKFSNSFQALPYKQIWLHANSSRPRKAHKIEKP